MKKQEIKNWWESELVNHPPSKMVTERKELIYKLNKERIQNRVIESDCCGAEIHLTDICIQCGEHCEPSFSWL